ncbi:uncharacterized protein LOC134265355 [Saccostrea cucullata]|uniref:uncharacterized protein LOC134265355 n=1 Tax=Saccostrea cuccullata TaxID=36930 RepID=UPI002ED68A22
MAFKELQPSEIYFSQRTIASCFRKESRYAKKLIGETLDDLVVGRCRIEDFPKISVVKKNGVWVSADNRRLWILRQLEALGLCERTKVKVRKSLGPGKYVIEEEVQIRGNPGGVIYTNISQIVHECLEELLGGLSQLHLNANQT